ncbi:MAG: acetylornithine transaminase [Austwickia sp.]|nr:acetylornithine transaminase [Austwickia sp.]
MVTGPTEFTAQLTESAWLDRYAGALLPVFGRPQRVLSHGAGAHVWDVEGNRYLDLLAGIAVNALGHAHPDLVAAITAQAGRALHYSNFFTSLPQIELAERLLRLADAPPGSAVFFTNSGTEALEAAIKLTRRTDRVRMLAVEGAFHGRSTGAVALTHKEAYRAPFAPLIPGVAHLPFNDEAALRQAFAADTDHQIAALFLEPVQGEAGVLAVDPGYLRLARDLTREHGALLILDEVQTGVARTGDWFAFQRDGVLPDAFTLAKGLAGGVPIGALVTIGSPVTALLSAGQHGSTFGGNPLACAAALTVLNVIERDDLMTQARVLGEHLKAAIAGLGHPDLGPVRGRGLLLGIPLRRPVAAELATAALAAGFIVNAPNPHTVRLAPPLILTTQEADSFVAALPGLLEELQP